MKRNYIGEINNKNILFLQGPMGGFFKRLDLLFRMMGAKTCKIGFNAGDCFFSNRDNYIAYRGRREAWPEYVADFLKSHWIDQIYLFGDCRFYQRHAITAAKALGIEVFVFEEGYVRPDYITLEKYGVNDYSSISRSRAFYDSLRLDELPEPTPKPAHFSQPRMVGSAVVYYALSNLLFFRYPHYRHHRDFSALKELFIGGRSLLRKWYYRWSERHALRWIEAEAGNYFFVPLQTHNDFQILEHSGYGSIEKFIDEVMGSFARCAPVGTVTINSTVGLSSLFHGTPTITLGNAIYDIEGLTCRGMTLDDFWHEQRAPDRELFEKYRRFLIHATQLNGSFYGEMPDFEARQIPVIAEADHKRGAAAVRLRRKRA
ncbi:MAG: capsular biosynthesis protein [Campylobacterales bacterium]